MNRAGALWAAIALQAMLASPAIAQTTSPDAVIDRVEALADRGGEIASVREPVMAFKRVRTGEAAETKKPKRWNLAGDLSFSYTDNAAFAETGGVDDAHLMPNLRITREIPLSKSTMLTIQLRSDFDLFTEDSANDTSAWTINSQIKFGDDSKRIAPYIFLTNNGIYLGQWGQHANTTHTVGLGASRKIALRDKGTLALDLNLVRREATSLRSEANRAQFSLGYSGPLAKDWSWSVNGRLRYFDYTGGTASAREDVQLRTSLGVTRKLSDVVSLSGAIAFMRNWSNVANRSYTNIDLGPTLTFGTKF